MAGRGVRRVRSKVGRKEVWMEGRMEGGREETRAEGKDDILELPRKLWEEIAR